MYHKPAAEPYILPYQSDHPRYVHANTVTGAFFRAVRLCSSSDRFLDEYLRIQTQLVLNGYPPLFVQYHAQKFFQRYSIETTTIRFSEEEYQQIHHTLLKTPTRRDVEGFNSTSSHQPSDINVRMINITIKHEAGSLSILPRTIAILWRQHFAKADPYIAEIKVRFRRNTNRSNNRQLIQAKIT